jgi:MFS family permease
MAESEPEALADTRGGWGRTFESLSVPQYRVLFSSSFLLFAALHMTVVARPWLAYNVSDSALSLGFVAAAQGVATLIASPFAGVAADSLPKRSVLLASHAALLVGGVVLAPIAMSPSSWEAVEPGVLRNAMAGNCSRTSRPRISL